jgi:hypothetical protein
MSWHQPDLYFFLGLLTGLAALLAIIYECIQKFRRRKPPVVEPRRSTVEGGRFAIATATEVRRFAIAAKAAAIALQSALREHEGRAAEGTSKPRA